MKVRDHLGNEFDSEIQMCEHWNINHATFKQRLSVGWSLMEALTNLVKDFSVQDHLGNVFISKTEMCEHWNITKDAFNHRIAGGYSLEDALTIPMRTHKRMCKDHLGREHSSITDMCRYWNITKVMFDNRTKKGWSLEEILTTPRLSTPKGRSCKDHLGNVFISQNKMCEYWKVDRVTFKDRIKAGWSLEDALTKDNAVKQPCKDHLGNEFSSKTEMCEYWNIDRAFFDSRVSNGWTIEKILTTPHQPSKNECQDHLGNTYSSIREMCDEHKVPYHTFISRVASYGWSVEQALTEPLKDNTCYDHLGKEHSSITSMCKYWNVELPTYIQRLKRGCDIETALTSDTRISFLEDAVRVYLLSKAITYKREHTFSDCRFEESGWLAYFDFYIPEIGIIEVDGKQHFEVVSIFGGFGNFQKTQKHDAIKTTYCEEHNIPLLRIRYDQLKNDVYKSMIDDFLVNPKGYINKHNMYLDNKEYYKVS